LKKILAVITDWQTAPSVIDRSQLLAGGLAGDIVVYRPVHDQLEELNRYIGFDNYQELRDQILVDEQASMVTLLEGQKLESVLEWQSKPYVGIVSQAKRIDADMVIMAVSRHSVLGDLMLKPDDWHLVRDAPCPVLLITRKKHAVQSVIAAIDCLADVGESHALAGRILDRARAMADVTGVPLHVLSVLPDPAMISAVMNDSPVMLSFRDEAENMARSRQQKLIERIGVAVEKSHFSFGRLEEVLHETVTAEQLLVIGTSAHRGLWGIVHGNSAERLLHQLQGDMLVVS